MDPVANQNKKETHIKCKRCDTEISSNTNNSLTSCKCGAISVDGSKDLVRVIGKPEDYEEIKRLNIEVGSVSPTSVIPKKENPVLKFIFKVLREILAIVFWSYLFVKLFIFDVDIYIFNKFLPDYTWLLNLKFFILIGLLAAIWLFTKSKHVFQWSLYVLLYPLIIFFWKIPFFIFKQKSWLLAFAFINAVISFFKSLKYNFIATSLFLVSVMTILIFSDKKVLWISSTLILLILSVTYIHRFILVFKPSSIFQVYIKIFSGIKKHGVSLFARDESIKDIEVADLTSKQLEKWTANLQTSVLFNRVCLFAAKKLRDYQNSGLNIIYYVLTILLLILITIFSFAVINFGLYKIDSNFFNFPDLPNFFTFFYYSFNNLLFNQIQELIAVGPVSQTTSMIESFFALFLIVIFVSLLISVRGQKHTEELNEVIKGVEEQGLSMEGFIRDEYKINNIDDAMAELEKLKAGLTKFIFKITESIK